MTIILNSQVNNEGMRLNLLRHRERIKRDHVISLILIGLFAAWAILSYNEEGVIHALLANDQGALESQLQQVGVLAPVVFTFVVIVEVLLAPVPGGPLYVVAGILFDPITAILSSLVGNVVGAYIAFLLARRYGRHVVERLIDKDKLRKFDAASEKKGAFAVFLLRLVPVTSSDIVSYMSGLTTMKGIKFLAATILGLFPLIVVQVVVGNVLKNFETFYLLFIYGSIAYFFVIVGLIVWELRKQRA